MIPRLVLILPLLGAALSAHPMGNFSISHYARLLSEPGRVEMVYALDLAEIPTFELMREWGVDRNSPQLEDKAESQARRWLENLSIARDGRAVAPKFVSASLVVTDGAGNLPVMRITTRARLDAGPGKWTYEDRNYPDRAGWKEIVIAAEKGVKLLEATQDSRDDSKGLTAYPTDPALAPPGDVLASFRSQAVAVRVSKPASAAMPVIRKAQYSAAPANQAPGTVQRGDALSRLLSRQDLSFGLILVGLGMAFVWGAMHALSPGHGKTIVAAYLVGSRGTFHHALLLGGMVTFTHTASVFLLGLGTMFLSRYVVPDKIFPVLTTISGLMIVVIGAYLFYQRLQRLIAAGQHHHHHDHHHHDHDHEHERAHAHAHANAAGHSHHDHDHPHDHDHHHDHDHDHHHDHHHDHDHHHGPGGHSHVIEGEVNMSSLIGLAVSGGLVPCPSALVLLLSAIAIGRIGFGMALLTSFSLGLAIVLVAIGSAVLYAKNLLPETPRVTGSPFFRMLPVISAAIITCVGLFMTAMALGWIKPTWIV